MTSSSWSSWPSSRRSRTPCSKHANMKKLRFEASNGEWRAAFAFDPRRRAILLVAGGKTVGARSAFTGSLSQRRTNGFRRIWIA
ncbi:MAG TPA: type II toxin-antitoxin system RelE/ParE family toxin [Stellaceae bacterium]|nr:type II toxin-antitoxin system RelE/ParE family toxin [Stellaceae bacterium]